MISKTKSTDGDQSEISKHNKIIQVGYVSRRNFEVIIYLILMYNQQEANVCVSSCGDGWRSWQIQPLCSHVVSEGIIQKHHNSLV